MDVNCSVRFVDLLKHKISIKIPLPAVENYFFHYPDVTENSLVADPFCIVSQLFLEFCIKSRNIAVGNIENVQRFCTDCHAINFLNGHNAID